MIRSHCRGVVDVCMSCPQVQARGEQRGNARAVLFQRNCVVLPPTRWRACHGQQLIRRRVVAKGLLSRLGSCWKLRSPQFLIASLQVARVKQELARVVRSISAVTDAGTGRVARVCLEKTGFDCVSALLFNWMCAAAVTDATVLDLANALLTVMSYERAFPAESLPPIQFSTEPEVEGYECWW